MSQWSVQDWATFLGVAVPAAAAFYLKVIRPLLAQITELIDALRQNTAATDTSADALVTLAPVVEKNTTATQAASDASDATTAAVVVNTADRAAKTAETTERLDSIISAVAPPQ